MIGTACKRNPVTFMGMPDTAASGPNMYRLSTQMSTAPVASAALRRDSMMTGNCFSQTELTVPVRQGKARCTIERGGREVI